MNSVTYPSILSNTLKNTIEMNTKTLDKVRSDLKLIINQNQQIQSEINIVK